MKQKIDWKKLPDQEDPRLMANPYQRIESLCLEWDSKHSLQHLFEEGKTFAEASEEVDHTIDKFQRKMNTLSLLSVILLWAQYMGKDKALGAKRLSMLSELMEEGLFPPKKKMTLKEFALSGHDSVIDHIRSFSKWFLQKREDFVTFYVEFGNWLSQATYGFIPIVTDLDRQMTARRKLPFETYIDLLALLPEREHILTKLFYLGGERALEEVLNLEIKHIDFAKGHIHFPGYFVRYPMHVLDDLKAYIEERKKGFVFLSKQGERINHTVPYRALKVAAQKLGLPSTFTFKDLVKEF